MTGFPRETKNTHLTTSLAPTPLDKEGRLKALNSSSKIDIPVSSTSAEAFSACLGNEALARGSVDAALATLVPVAVSAQLKHFVLLAQVCMVFHSPTINESTYTSEVLHAKHLPTTSLLACKHFFNSLVANKRASFGLCMSTVVFLTACCTSALAPSAALAASRVAASAASNFVACTGGVGVGV